MARKSSKVSIPDNLLDDFLNPTSDAPGCAPVAQPAVPVLEAPASTVGDGGCAPVAQLPCPHDPEPSVTDGCAPVAQPEPDDGPSAAIELDAEAIAGTVTLDEAVAHIKAIAPGWTTVRSQQAERSEILAIGKYLLSVVYGDDIEAYRAVGKSKAFSLDALAGALNRPKTALGRAVRAAFAERTLGPGIGTNYPIKVLARIGTLPAAKVATAADIIDQTGGDPKDETAAWACKLVDDPDNAVALIRSLLDKEPGARQCLPKFLQMLVDGDFADAIEDLTGVAMEPFPQTIPLTAKTLWDVFEVADSNDDEKVLSALAKFSGGDVIWLRGRLEQVLRCLP